MRCNLSNRQVSFICIQSAAGKLCIVAWRQTYNRKYKILPRTYKVHTRHAHASGGCGLFSWSMAAGLLAFSSCQFARSLSIKSGPCLCPLHTIFPSWASVAGGVCRPRREAPCIYYDGSSVLNSSEALYLTLLELDQLDYSIGKISGQTWRPPPQWLRDDMIQRLGDDTYRL